MRTIAFAIVCAGLLAGQAAKQANSHYATPEERRAVAAGLGRPDRDKEQKPQELVEAMQIRPGMVVADIGTGVGYMLPWLSRAVGPGGRVIGEDIFDDFLSAARNRASEDKLANVTFVKGTERDPNLPENGVDVVLALDSYHHYNYPEAMLAGIRRGLHSDGRLVVVEYYRRPEAMPGGGAMTHIRADQPAVIQEVESAGFRLLSKHDHIPGRQYMLVFEKN